MYALVMACVLFLSFLSSVLASSNAIPYGDKNTVKVSPRTAGLASGALDPFLFLSASKPSLLPIELPAEAGLQGILTMDSTEAQLCPHFALRNFALTNPHKTRYSAPWRVACGVDFYGGDLFPEPVSTQDGPVGCSVTCQQTSKCKGAVFWPSSDNPRSGSCYLKKTLNDPISRAGFAAIVRRNDMKPDFAVMTDKRFFEGQRYDAIADVFDIDTDDGEHRPHEKLFKSYVHDMETNAGVSTGAVVSTSSSSVSSSATPSISSSASTSAQATASPVPIYFSTSPNSAVVLFVPASSEVASSTRTNLLTAVVSMLTASITPSSVYAESTLSPDRIDSVIIATPTSAAHTVASAMLAEGVSSAAWSPFAAGSISPPPSSTLFPTSTSPWSTSLASDTALVSSLSSDPVASPFRTTFTTDNKAEPTAKPASSFKTHLDGLSTVEWKSAVTAVSNSLESIRPTLSPTEFAHGVESSQATSSFKVKMEGFPNDIEWNLAPTASMTSPESSRAPLSFKKEGFPSSVEWNLVPTETARPTVSPKAPFDWTLEWKSAPTASVADVEFYQADLLSTDIGPRPTLSKLDETGTATPTEVTEPLRLTST
ncbi:hypothetical protein DPSP01_013759 [Paraphaeosphaeria sporulosa]